MAGASSERFIPHLSTDARENAPNYIYNTAISVLSYEFESEFLLLDSIIHRVVLDSRYFILVPDVLVIGVRESADSDPASSLCDFTARSVKFTARTHRFGQCEISCRVFRMHGRKMCVEYWQLQ